MSWYSGANDARRSIGRKSPCFPPKRLTFEQIVSFYEQRVKGKPVAILIMGDPKQIDQKVLKAKYGKITKLSKSQLFSY